MRNDGELQGLLPHLCYEIKMLLATDLLLLRETNAPRDPNRLEEWAANNALLESHTVHARALYAFFFHDRGRSDDAIASDYVDDWSQRRPAPSPILLTVSPRVGKEIAHLTYGRLAYKTDESRQWAFTDVTRALVVVINTWLEGAPAYAREVLLDYIKDYAEQVEIRAVPHQNR